MCQVCEPEHAPSLTADSEPVGDELINDHLEPGFGMFDSGASSHAISAFELNQLHAEEPEAFTEIDETRRKVMGFDGGTQTFPLGVCTGPMSHMPIEWGVSNNTNSSKPDKAPPLIPIAWAREKQSRFDFDTGKFIFKDNPNQAYSAKPGRQSNGQIWGEVILVYFLSLPVPSLRLRRVISKISLRLRSQHSDL